MGESKVVAGSKRSSLRFSMNEQRISYKTAYEDGEALLANISTGGCAVFSATVPVAEGDKLLFSFDILTPGEPFELRAICVRLEDDGFAVQFLGVDISEANRIIKLLATRARSEKK